MSDTRTFRIVDEDGDYYEITGDPMDALNAAYRERAHLVALLAALYPSEMHENPDADYDNWPIVMVKTPAGQMGWHLAPNDVDLFDHVVFERTVDWDGHSTEEKYRRVRELTSELYGQGIEAIGGYRGGR
jgi:hypothetical protein